MSDLSKLLKEEIAQRRRETAALEKALETIESRKEPSQPKTSKPRRKSTKKYGKGVSDQRLQKIREAIKVVAAEKEEFRPVDVSRQSGIDSGVMSPAFRILREEKFIRPSRFEGNSQWHRLWDENLISDNGEKAVIENVK